MSRRAAIRFYCNSHDCGDSKSGSVLRATHLQSLASLPAYPALPYTSTHAFAGTERRHSERCGAMERGRLGLEGRFCTTAAPHPLPTSQSSSHFTPPRLPLLPTSHCCPHPTPLHLPLLSTSHESPPPRPLSHAYTMPILGFPHCSHTAHCGTHLLPYSPPPTLLLTSHCRTPYPPIDTP